MADPHLRSAPGSRAHPGAVAVVPRNPVRSSPSGEGEAAGSAAASGADYQETAAGLHLNRSRWGRSRRERSDAPPSALSKERRHSLPELVYRERFAQQGVGGQGPGTGILRVHNRGRAARNCQDANFRRSVV